MLGTVLSAGNSTMTKADKNPFPSGGAYILVRR